MTGEDGGYTVVGGGGGIEADMDDMDATGSQIRQTGWDLGETALETHGFLVDGNLLASALFSPGSFATFESGLLGALDGPGGLSANAVRMTATGTFMQAKAKAYAATDAALEYSEDITEYTRGYLYGAALLTNPVLTGGITALTLQQQGLFEDPEAWLVEHPDAVEEIVASAPGTLDFFLPGSGFPTNTEQGAALLALLYDQELGGLTSETVDGTAAPENLQQAMKQLREAADTTDGFRIERVGHPPDEAYNIYLPGTKAFDGPFGPGTPGVPDGAEDSGLVQNLGTNFAGVAGADNAYVEAVLRAMAEAGIPPDAPVNLLGHSQGGIIAARVAEAVTAADNPNGYNVTSVVTAGSPVDHIELPESVEMLSLVNEYDIVPRLDGEAYDDRSNHTTIVTEVQTGSVTGNHDMEGLYVPMSRDLEASDDPAIQNALAPLEAFMPGGQSQTWFYEMERR